MFLRVFAVLTLAGVIGGGTWYLVRSTPAKEVERLREKIQDLVYSEQPSRWERAAGPEGLAELKAAGKELKDFGVRIGLAREAAERILEIAPNSPPDLGVRANLEELAGDPREALKVYERFARLKLEPAWVNLRKASILRRLGQYSRAGAELLAAVDEYPYEANLGSGQMALDLFLPDRALAHFRRALAAAADPREKPRERIDAQALIAEALNQLMALDQAPLRGSAREGGGDSEAARKVPGRPESWRRERDRALDEALSLERGIVPHSKQEFWEQKIRISRLLELYRDPDRAVEAVRELERAVAADEERRYTQLYLKLASLKLDLAARPDARGAGLLSAEAEGHFLQALEIKDSLLRRSNLADEEGIPESATPSSIALVLVPTPEALRDNLILQIADRYLGTAEHWRLFEGEREGRKDRLELKAHLERLGRGEKGGAAGRTKLLKALALLRAGREAESEALLDEVLAGIPREARPLAEARLAELSLRANPGSLLFLKPLRRNLEPGAEGRVPVGIAARVLRRGLAHRQARLASGEPGEAGDVRQRLEEEIAAIARVRDDIVSRATLEVEGPGEYLSLAGIVAGVSGREQAIAILKLGRDKHDSPDPGAARSLLPLRQELGGWLFERAVALEFQARKEKGQAVDAAGPWWQSYREAAGEYLHLFREYPFRREFLQRLLAVISRFKAEASAPDLELHQLVRSAFPRASAPEATAMAGMLEDLARGEFAGTLGRVDALSAIESLRPHSTLILGEALIREAKRLAPEAALAGGGPGAGKELRARARALFTEELRRSPEYLPLRVGLAWADFEDLAPEEDVPDALLKQLREMVERVEERQPVAYPLFLLQARALGKRFEHLLRGREEKKEGPAATPRALATLVAQRRTALRRAIQASPEIPDTYLLLAETYLGFGGAAGRLVLASDSSGDLLEPDYERAIHILKAAPETPATVGAIGRIYQESLLRPGEAQESFRELVRIDPTAARLRDLVVCFMASADPAANANPRAADREGHANARAFLDEFERRVPSLPPESGDLARGYPLVKLSLLALIDLDEARSATELDAKRLRARAIQSYREVRDQYRAAGAAPPLDVMNNLAWVLAEDAQSLDEARQTIEEAREKLLASLDARSARMVEDTYGWILHQQGELAKAEEVYEKLVEAEPAPSYRYRYAKVLSGLNKLREAQDELKRVLGADPKFPELREAQRLKNEIEIKLQRKFARDSR